VLNSTQQLCYPTVLSNCDVQLCCPTVLFIVLCTAISVQDTEGSYDFVSRDHDVMPGFSGGKQDRHGTSCAGEIAMVKDNGVCGVGVAYDSRISGLL